MPLVASAVIAGVFSRLLEDEIEQLHDHLREVTDENGRLYKLVKERDFEIRQLQKTIGEERLALSGKQDTFISLKRQLDRP